MPNFRKSPESRKWRYRKKCLVIYSDGQFCRVHFCNLKFKLFRARNVLATKNFLGIKSESTVKLFKLSFFRAVTRITGKKKKGWENYQRKRKRSDKKGAAGEKIVNTKVNNKKFSASLFVVQVKITCTKPRRSRLFYYFIWRYLEWKGLL